MIYQLCKDSECSDFPDTDGLVVSFSDFKNNLKVPIVVDCSFVSTDEILQKNLEGDFYLLNLNEENIIDLQLKNKNFYGRYVVNVDDIGLTEDFCLKHGIEKFFLETKDKSLNEIQRKVANLFKFCAYNGIWPNVILTSPDVYNQGVDLKEFVKFYNSFNKDHVSIMTTLSEVYSANRFNEH